MIKPPVKEDEEEDKEKRTESGLENEIIDSVPKTLKQKARRLLDKIKGTVSWNDRGEMVYRNVPVPGSNIVDLVNDALRKRKSFQPVGWKMFARGLKDVNAPMDLIGNPERWTYIQTATPSVAGGASKETTPIAGSSGRRPSYSSSRKTIMSDKWVEDCPCLSELECSEVTGWVVCSVDSFEVLCH